MTFETDVLEPEETEAVLRQINTRSPTGARNRALILLMVRSGLRCAEALAARPAHIREETWDGKRLHVLRLPKSLTKGKRPRDPIPLAPEVTQAMDLWSEHRRRLGIRSQAYFCTVSSGRRDAGFARSPELTPGKPLSPRYVRQLVSRLAARAGIERRVHPHMLRHTALTAAYERAKDLRLVQHIAVHSSSRMSERYTHVRPIATARAMGAVVDVGADADLTKLIANADPEQLRDALRTVLGL